MAERGILVGGQWIRTTTPEMRATFAGNGVLDPINNVIRPLRAGETMAVDHIFPAAKTIELRGFDTLTREQMTNILQDKIGLGNLQPLPQSFNASKGLQTDWSTYGTGANKQMLNSTYVSDLMRLQNDIQDKIQSQIRTYQQANRQGR
jgi:hypothetical protein